VTRFNLPVKELPHADDKRICVWVPSPLHRHLRSVLILEGVSVSRWFREQAEAYLRSVDRRSTK
jgi:hypothetical protein